MADCAALGDGKPNALVDIAFHIGSLIQARPFDVCLDRVSAFGGWALVLRSGDHSPALQAFCATSPLWSTTAR
ncbi:hypothetical protein [Mesorhizobium escarrei]|uniref:Uncharacterized protein n=1 Tax=Mesorhizobium escarrei TaxID=666018 RepID=A0ABN8JXH4_9HYPH|nr:hypothetical protein [Mesorhizobium escarrei]CAH2401738.1 hypothetical protein MES5069_30147 [Mesorhizobium escarrei]